MDLETLQSCSNKCDSTDTSAMRLDLQEAREWEKTVTKATLLNSVMLLIA